MADLHCPKCSHELTAVIGITLTMPASMMFNVTKAKIRRREVQISHTNWPKAQLWCMHCGWNNQRKEEG